MEKYEQYFIKLNGYKTNVTNMRLRFNTDDIAEFIRTYTDMYARMHDTVTTVLVF